jgi:short-subunit dehydrogenase
VGTHKNASPAVVWVTGASRGIGYEIANAFAATGAHVILTSRDKQQLHILAKQIGSSGGNATPLVCDVRSSAAVRSVARKILNRLGRVDVLVNNSGITSFKTFRSTSPAEFEDIIATNLRGTFLCTKAVLESMVRKRAGHIFNILSIAATKTFTHSAAYSASKAGALALTNVLREEVRAYNVKVTAVIAGATETEMWSQSSRRKYSRRMMQPKDIASLIVAIYNAPRRAHVEEVVVRPQLGDLP